ncbi:MAG: amino acid carrier protein [Candidatus Dependentiae bacterium]|nr:amino acid carrier protein [Candidatus Dependentiae bacterium]
MDIGLILKQISGVLVNWPLFILVIATGVLCTVLFRFIQVRYFMYAWKQIFQPSKPQTLCESEVACDEPKGGMTPLQAFINALSCSLGNGIIAGVATAIFAGGPGAALWLIIFGLLLMPVRFAEAFLSMHYAQKHSGKTSLGGPMLYLQDVIGGKVLSKLYAVLCLLFCFIGGNSIQTNSIRTSLATTFGLSSMLCAIAITLFIFYVVFGGAERIVKVSDKIVPVKVVVFCITMIIMFLYHYKSLGGALLLITQSALTPQAALGGLLGFSLQQALRAGMMRAIFATESGLGTAAILFGSTGSKAPMKDAIVAMLGTFMSTIACFLVALAIVASGVWNSGLNGTELTIAASATVFGPLLGGIIITFLAVSFGVGVLVSFAFITREVWLSLTTGRFVLLFNILYCLFAFGGALIDVKAVWSLGDIILALMLAINLFGILWLIPVIRNNVIAFGHQEK